jgi:hypothetical protein
LIDLLIELVHTLELTISTLSIKQVDIDFSAPDAFLEYHSSAQSQKFGKPNNVIVFGSKKTKLSYVNPLHAFSLFES